jgi:hypothetical protein
VRDSGSVRIKAVYLAIGVNLDGHKEVLGLWIAQHTSTEHSVEPDAVLFALFFLENVNIRIFRKKMVSVPFIIR